MEKSDSISSKTWLYMLLWLSFTGTVLYEGTVVIGIFGILAYALFFVGAFLGIKQEYTKLKSKDNPMSISCKVGSVLLIVVFACYIAAYAFVGIHDLMQVV